MFEVKKNTSTIKSKFKKSLNIFTIRIKYEDIELHTLCSLSVLK